VVASNAEHYGAGYFENQGKGAFKPASKLAEHWGVVGWAVGDIDGDGDTDLVGATSETSSSDKYTYMAWFENPAKGRKKK
jgi:hypothetical protein